MSDRPDDSEFEAKLWRSAHDEKPSAHVRESVLAAALAAGGVGGGGGGPSNAPPAPGGGAIGAKGIALGWKLAAVIALTAGAAAIFVAVRPAESGAPAAAPAAASPVPSVATTIEARPVVPATAPALASSEPSASPAEPPAHAPLTSATPTAPRAPTLADEIVAIDAARAAIERGDTSAALRALDGYDRTFPHGALAPEAAALRARVKKARTNVDAAAP